MALGVGEPCFWAEAPAGMGLHWGDAPGTSGGGSAPRHADHCRLAPSGGGLLVTCPRASPPPTPGGGHPSPDAHLWGTGQRAGVSETLVPPSPGLGPHPLSAGDPGLHSQSPLAPALKWPEPDQLAEAQESREHLASGETDPFPLLYVDRNEARFAKFDVCRLTHETNPWTRLPDSDSLKASSAPQQGMWD